jgi:hypothetical protein
MLAMRMYIVGYRQRRADEPPSDPLKLAPAQPVSMFVFTCALGFVVLQLVHVKVIGVASFTPAPGFDTSMAPFWPEPYPGLMWPLPVNLMNDWQFTALEGRWQTIGVID